MGISTDSEKNPFLIYSGCKIQIGSSKIEKKTYLGCRSYAGNNRENYKQKIQKESCIKKGNFELIVKGFHCKILNQ